MATLHYFYGWPGAGKTTAARALAASAPALLICEDEWLATLLTAPITSLEGYVEAITRLRRVIGPLTTRALTLGCSVVFDFGGNTVAHRAWVRELAVAAGAACRLHVLDVPPEVCRQRIRERNQARPAGLFYGEVDDALIDAVVAHIAPPTPDELTDVP
ncbi:MAG: ATP-binding protein [Myxococcales bacterium]|nr:ATP-binding protein [Myxococcales bacterium]